jgi:hypothetical protein
MRRDLMSNAETDHQDEPRSAPRILSPAAERALREADERRLATRKRVTGPPEHGGRQGPDPVRYGDWEKNGIASDF